MARPDKLLDRMRDNPRDWRIEDVRAVREATGVACTPPAKGSHYKVKHPDMVAILTTPAHRPVKPVYIREPARFIDAVQGKRP